MCVIGMIIWSNSWSFSCPAWIGDVHIPINPAKTNTTFGKIHRHYEIESVLGGNEKKLMMDGSKRVPARFEISARKQSYIVHQTHWRRCTENDGWVSTKKKLMMDGSKRVPARFEISARKQSYIVHQTHWRRCTKVMDGCQRKKINDGWVRTRSSALRK